MYAISAIAQNTLENTSYCLSSSTFSKDIHLVGRIKRARRVHESARPDVGETLCIETLHRTQY